MKKALLLLLTIALFTSCNSEDDATACMQTATYTIVENPNKSANKTTCDLTNDFVYRADPDSSLEPNHFYFIDLGFYYDDTVTDGKPYGNKWKVASTYPEDAVILVDYVFQNFGGEIGIDAGGVSVGQLTGNMEIEFTSFMSEEPYGKPRTTLYLQNALGSPSITPIYGDPQSGGTGPSVGFDIPINTGNIKITDINTCEVTYRTQGGGDTPTTAEVECSACGTTVVVDGVNYLIECNNQL